MCVLRHPQLISIPRLVDDTFLIDLYLIIGVYVL